MDLPVEVNGIEEMRALVGETIGPSPWRRVTQKDVDDFARLSGDDQWIHVDVERARSESPYGTTIAHGNLTLSMIDGLRHDLVRSDGFRFGVNYGWNRVRFPAPVPTGARIRASVELLSAEHVGDGWWQLENRFTVEVEDGAKPACVGDYVSRVLAE